VCGREVIEGMVGGSDTFSSFSCTTSASTGGEVDFSSAARAG